VKLTNWRDHINPQNERFGRSVVMSCDTAALFVYTFKPGQAMTDHTHPFSTEFVAVLQGEGLISVGTESILAAPGDVVFVPPEAVHAIHQRGTAPLVVASYMSPKP
jgi:quercetin dioxygenase-like cupin family protein